MNIDATEDDLRAAAEVLKFAAILDDRAPSADKARIAAWAEKIHKHQLCRSDLVDGLQAFYDNPSERSMQIGDLIHHARIIRRDRNEREEAADLDRRREVHDTKAVDTIRGLAARVAMGPTPRRTERLSIAENALQCVTNKHTAKTALAEYFAAKAEARKPQTRAAS